MTNKEVRMRCIEAIYGTGGQWEGNRAVQVAKILEEWVMAAEDKEPTPSRGRPKKAADKD